MKWDIKLVRQTINRINPEITRKALKWIAGAALVNKRLGFTARLQKVTEPHLLPAQGDDEPQYHYEGRIRLEHDSPGKPDTVKENLEKVLERLRRRAEAKGWSIQEGGDTHHVPASSPISSQPAQAIVAGGVQPFPPFILPKLTDDVMANEFGDIYERDAHIRVIHGAVETSLTSSGKVLSHVLLYGLPGACKTKLMEQFKVFYEKGRDDEPERVVFIDGTTMTKSGLERYLLSLANPTAREANKLPVVLVVDEIEKQPLDNLLCLNNIMGSGVFTRLNAHTGNLRIPATFTVVGICNDEKMLKDFRNGALWSRFTHKLYCARPSRLITREILEKVAMDMGLGELSRQLAEAALEFGWDRLQQRDIRELKGHLDGRERLITGEWQRDHFSISNSKRD